MNSHKNKQIIIGLLMVFITAIILSLFFDKGLSISLSLLLFFSGLTLFILYKLGLRDKKIYLLFLIVLLLRLSTTLFMHYADFQPFSGHGGDYITYQRSALEIYQSFRNFDFSVKDVAARNQDFFKGHYYPVLVGALYFLTLPEQIIPLMLNVWLSVITICIIYLIILEIGGSQRNAFIIGLIVTIYPAYVFNSGLLLKDALEIFFIFLSLIFIIKLIKKFSWPNFLILYASLMGATHFRFYIGYALIATFVIFWFLYSHMDFKKKITYGILLIIILGFVPQITTGHGYYGINSIKQYLNFNMINFYRKIAYNPSAQVGATPTAPVVANATQIASPSASVVVPISSASASGVESSFVPDNTPLGYLKSFIYVLLGPLPWQIKNPRQALALLETIPWYFLLFFVVDGVIIVFKKSLKNAFPLLFFSLLLTILIAIFDPNFGLIVRIRIPVFISLLSVSSLSPEYQKVLVYFKKTFEDISKLFQK